MSLAVQHHKYKYFKLTTALSAAALFAAGVYFLHPFTSDSTSALTDTVNINVDSTPYYLSLSSDGSVALDVNSTSVGSYAYGSDTVNVKTNVESGYRLYLTSSNSSTSALSTPGSSDTIAMATGTGGATGTPAILSVNSYGYGVPRNQIGNNNFDPSYTNPTSSSKWAKVPAGTTDLIRTRNTNTGTDISTDTGEDTNVYYGVYANNGIQSGTYTGTVVYSAVAEMPSSAISISPNSTPLNYPQTVKVMSGPIIAAGTAISTDKVSIKINNIDCTVSNVDTSNGYLITTCIAPAFASAGSYDVSVAVDTYGYSASITGGYSAVSTSGLDTITDMQDATSALCAGSAVYSPTSPNQYTLTDSRDGNQYVIRKLADGNCWMSQNLRLSAESLTAHGHTTTLNATDTDVTSSFTMPASTQWDSYDGTNPHVIRAQDAPVGQKSSEGGTPISEPTATYRGTYYNWPAAVASNGTISSTTSTTYTTSICPKGWKLPTGAGTIEGTSTTTTNQFQTLYEAYGSNKTNMDKELHYYNGNNSATYAGNWYPGYVYLVYSGTGVSFWSSTTSTTAGSAWFLYENSSSGIYPADSNSRGFGFSVRCILAGS